MASPVPPTIEHNSSKTGLVSSVNSQRPVRSYGTVNEPSKTLSQKALTSSCLTHDVDEDDTLQGLALKYNVTVHQIQKLNNLWGSETIQSRSSLKIPHVSRSLTSTPVMSIAAEREGVHTNHDRLTSSLESSGEVSEVRKKKRRDQHTSCGERTVASILSSADEQLRLSREFAEKLAKKSAALKRPVDAYNRSNSNDSEKESSTENHVDHHTHWEPSARSKRRRKRAERSASQSREELENNMFEL